MKKGTQHSAETRKKMSEVRKKLYENSEYRNKFKKAMRKRLNTIQKTVDARGYYMTPKHLRNIAKSYMRRAKILDEKIKEDKKK